ncbi:hypothetical protein ACJX0J_029400, partial [Zea mays]
GVFNFVVAKPVESYITTLLMYELFTYYLNYYSVHFRKFTDLFGLLGFIEKKPEIEIRAVE